MFNSSISALKNLFVICDFDGTLIKKEVAGQTVPSLMSLLIQEKYIGQDGVAAVKELVNHYYPLENDPSLDLSERQTLMQEWWEKSYSLMKQYQITEYMIEEVCSSPLVQFRDGLIDFLNFLVEHTIPLIIFSASGVGQKPIKYLLEKNNLLTENISIFSNDLVFDQQGLFIDVKPPILHSANKVGHTLVKNGIIAPRPERQHCLVVGDNPDDAQMSEGLDCKSVYKVIFTNQQHEKVKQNFQLILPMNDGYQKILALIK